MSTFSLYEIKSAIETEGTRWNTMKHTDVSSSFTLSNNVWVNVTIRSMIHHNLNISIFFIFSKYEHFTQNIFNISRTILTYN